MNAIEQQFIIWACLTLLGIIAFALVLFVKAFMQLVKDVNTIKTTIQLQGLSHQFLEKRVEVLEDKLL